MRPSVSCLQVPWLHHFLPEQENCFTSPCRKQNDSIQTVPGSGPFDENEGRFLPDSDTINPANTSIGDNPRAERWGETLVGGVPVSMSVLSQALRFAPRLTGVDGGADTILDAGLRPDRVVGDLDSLSDAARTAFGDVLFPIAEQDSTDFGKALRTSDAPFFIGVGFIGARVDHFLACISELARRTSGAPCVLLGEEDCLCILPKVVEVSLPVGTRLSLWPVGACFGRSAGLEWPIDGLDFNPAGRVGTSNRTTAHKVRLEIEGGPMVLLLPAQHLPAMLAMLEIDARPTFDADV